MADVIELSSSDDEDNQKPVKKKQKISNQTVIELTDDDEDEPPVKHSDTNKTSTNTLEKTTQNDQPLPEEEDKDVLLCEEDPLALNIPVEDTNGKDTDASLLLEEEDICNLTSDEDDDNTSKESKENKPSSNISQIQVSNAVSLNDNNEPPISEELQKFIEACREAILDSSRKKLFEEKVPLLIKRYKRAEQYILTDPCKEKLATLTEKVMQEPKMAIPLFHEMFLDLQANTDSEERTARVLDKLYSRFQKLEKRVKILEEREVNFDDEDDSSYIMMQRYRDRTAEVLKKIKTLEKSDWRQGLTYYSRLDYAKSSYPEINRAINRRFQCREKDPFPTFASVDKCVRKCVTNNNMKWNEGQIRLEVKSCFEGLGNLLQRRRKTDLACNHYCFLTDINFDPASKDSELERKLRENHKHGAAKLNSVVEKFVAQQETGINPDLSADSDDSNREDSDEDN